MIRRGHLIGIAGASVGGVLLLTIFAVHAYSAKSVPVSGVANERATIERELAHETPATAYAAFKVRWSRAEFSQKHNMAHLFGSELYDRVGLAGIGACDADFNYGCYHGFMTEAIAQEGFTVIPKLTAACSATAVPESCDHGIGHGVVEYLNHTDLPRALATCGTPPATQPITGCLTGAFMEYNEPILFDEKGTAYTHARPIADKKKPYDVCTQLDAAYKSACYFSLPQWWYQVYGENYVQMGQFCAGAGTYARDCYSGIGNIAAPSSGFDVATTIASCGAMPTAEGRSACLVDASGAFTAAPGGAAGSAKVCAAAPPAAQSFCAQRKLVN